MNVKSECYRIYCEAFGEDDFAVQLFTKCFKYCKYCSANNMVASILFLLPCRIDTGKEIIKAKYVFAVATKKELRGKGYATMLLNSLSEDEVMFLKPSDEHLVAFYKKSGFKTFTSIYSRAGEKRVLLDSDFYELACKYERVDLKKYTAMYRYKNVIDLDNLNFAYTME